MKKDVRTIEYGQSYEVKIFKKNGEYQDEHVYKP